MKNTQYQKKFFLSELAISIRESYPDIYSRRQTSEKSTNVYQMQLPWRPGIFNLIRCYFSKSLNKLSNFQGGGLWFLVMDLEAIPLMHHPTQIVFAKQYNYYPIIFRLVNPSPFGKFKKKYRNNINFFSVVIANLINMAFFCVLLCAVEILPFINNLMSKHSKAAASLNNHGHFINTKFDSKNNYYASHFKKQYSKVSFLQKINPFIQLRTTYTNKKKNSFSISYYFFSFVIYFRNPPLILSWISSYVKVPKVHLHHS